MLPYDADALIAFVSMVLPERGPLFLFKTMFEVCNNRLSRKLLEGDVDLHGMPETIVDGFLVYIWSNGAIERFAFFFDQQVTEPRTREIAGLLQSIEGGTPVDDASVIATVKPSPAYVVAACVRLITRGEGQHSIALYHNPALSQDEALGFIKRKIDEYAAENGAPKDFS